MTKSKPRSAASTNEAAVYAARGTGYCRCRGLYPRAQSGRGRAGARGYSPITAESRLVSAGGQSADRRRSAQAVTRKYPYLVYYRVDEAAEEVIILTIQHPAREREHEDA